MNESADVFHPDEALEKAVREDVAASFDPQDIQIPAELRQCGAVIDKAIGYLIEKDMPPEMIASALLGGSLGILARTTDAPTMVRMLQTAIDSVHAGELTLPDGADSQD
ncbi:hypothetical protein AA101099_1233 [Neoasaia chiangmaiensis NBRC 101099]|uniref:hypothetical protein n=1 Tax=Neoasaia chiangmaiensis TaxID=320497 RepID=UPI0011972F40|nr:hypothetical protein [Neoasaia chiangmaiensis]GBR38539.1 hypothetical protein AA101099_1233 [Neoasaia chiangmaiensis NBRC 101099]GEN15851.1 hypothetical protein NCH01_22820 [Neoasaia chiangmaiensis]